MNTRLITFIALIAFSTILFTSCDKDENGNIITASMSAKVDGTQWEANLFTNLGTKYKNSIVFGGIKGVSSKIGFVIFNVGEKIETKKYDLNLQIIGESTITIPKAKTMGTFTDVKNPDNPTAKLNYYSTQGYVTITKVDADNRISGTFEFTAMNLDKKTKRITEGKFNNVKLVPNPIEYIQTEDPK